MNARSVHRNEQSLVNHNNRPSATQLSNCSDILPRSMADTVPHYSINIHNQIQRNRSSPDAWDLCSATVASTPFKFIWGPTPTVAIGVLSFVLTCTIIIVNACKRLCLCSFVLKPDLRNSRSSISPPQKFTVVDFLNIFPEFGCNHKIYRHVFESFEKSMDWTVICLRSTNKHAQNGQAECCTLSAYVSLFFS